MKSGTTLLRSLMSNHPRIFGGLETHWFSDGFQDQWRDPKATATARLLDFFDIDGATYRNLRDHSTNSESFLENTMNLCAAQRGKQRWVEKTPGNILHLERIWQHWPEAVFFHVIRDLRDVYASWKRNGKYDLNTFVDHVKRIQDLHGDRLGTTGDRYLEVYYRDLVTQPTETMTRVLAFCGESFVPGVDENRKGMGEYEKVLAVTGKASPTLRSLARPIFTDSLGQWRRHLTSAEVQTITSQLRPYIEKTHCLDAQECETP